MGYSENVSFEIRCGAGAGEIQVCKELRLYNLTKPYHFRGNIKMDLKTFRDKNAMRYFL